MEIQKIPLQKSNELPKSARGYTVELTVANRQFDWLERSLVFDRSDKHSTICSSYNAGVASTPVQGVSIEKFGNTYSMTNKLNYDIKDATEKYMLYKQFITQNCNGCSVAPLTDYANNPIYQELPTKNEYFSTSNESIYLDLRDSMVHTGELKNQNVTTVLLF